MIVDWENVEDSLAVNVHLSFLDYFAMQVFSTVFLLIRKKTYCMVSKKQVLWEDSYVSFHPLSKHGTLSSFFIGFDSLRNLQDKAASIKVLWKSFTYIKVFNQRSCRYLQYVFLPI